MANTKSVYNFSFGNATHVGQVRKANEDYFGSFETKNGYIFLVCDGMGGHVGGAKASQIAVSNIRDCLQQLDYATPYEALTQSLISSNKAILDYAEEHSELRGMGTTCVAILIKGADVYYAHVGDSRIYLFSKKKLTRITKDHSFVQNMVDIGGLTEEEAETHPRKNEITNALGLVNMKPPTVCSAPILAAKGDIFVLCSDGLTGLIKDSEIEDVLKNNMELQGKANLLIDKANQAGGTDNITVQIIGFNQSPYSKTITNIQSVSKPPKRQGAKRNKLYLYIAALVLVLSFGQFLRSNFYSHEEHSITKDSVEFRNQMKKLDSIKNVEKQKNIDSSKMKSEKYKVKDNNKLNIEVKTAIDKKETAKKNITNDSTLKTKNE